jgi:type IV secretory pathway VirB4 component
MKFDLTSLLKSRITNRSATSPAPVKPVSPPTKTTSPSSGRPPVAQKTVAATVEAKNIFSQGTTSIQDIIAPPAIEVDFNHLKIGGKYFRTLFVAGYPRYVSPNWLSPLINFDHSLDISMFIYPIEGKGVLDDLRRKIAEMEAEINMDTSRGVVINPATQAKLEDALSLQEELVKGVERFFQFGLYVTIVGDTPEELDHVSRQVDSMLGSLLIITKPATLQAEEGFKTTMPVCQDPLMVTRNMDTTSLATTFPFTSSELTANEGVLYGINEYNESLVIFDRFTLENANLVVFAKSGAGKSYLVKLEALRSLMFGTEIIIIDPENEYKNLCEAVGGEFINFSFNSPTKINPFDLSQIYTEGENELGMKLLSLHSLFKVIMGELDSTQEVILDRALVATYKMKGITPDPTTQRNEPPLMEDLYKTLLGMEDPQARSLADKIEKFIKGSMVGIFDQKSNIDIKNPFTVFALRDLEDTLRPITMFIILDYIWTRIRKELKKRILIVDEAWYLMKYPDSANFLHSIAKRARKYYLGLTTISQNVEDFLTTDLGKAIITNSSIQILMKQHPAAINKVAETFYLSEGERQLLLSADIGEGLFFAGRNHVAIQVIASPEEHNLVTTSPKEMLAGKEELTKT